MSTAAENHNNRTIVRPDPLHDLDGFNHVKQSDTCLVLVSQLLRRLQRRIVLFGEVYRDQDVAE